MAKTHQLDLTKGPIFPLIIRFALPLCIGSILQQMYSTVDTLVIGNFGGTTSLAAIGTSSQPMEILLCLFLGIGSGVSILVAQNKGCGNTEKLRSTAQNAVTMNYLCAVPLTFLGVLLGPWILRLMQVPEDTLPAAVTYLQIMFLGSLAQIGYNINSGILGGMGDSRASLYFLLASCGMNIGLDLLLVGVFRMDVAGAAIATVISQFFSWLLSAGYLHRRYRDLDAALLPRHFRPAVVKEILRISIPLGVNNSFYSFGHTVMQLLINTQGSAFMAACSIATRINGMANIAITSLSSSATTFSGQNLGAGKYTRLRQGAWRVPAFSGALSLVSGLIFTALCRPILGLFSSDPEVLDLAVVYVRTVLPFYWAYAVFNTILCFVNGMGLVRFSTVVNLLMLWVVRIPTALIIVKFFNGLYVMVALPISFVFGMIAAGCYFFTEHWKNIGRRAEMERRAEESGE